MASEQRKRLSNELEGFVEQIMRRLQLRAMQVLTVETPVLSGFARAGWSPSTGTPDRTGPSEPGEGLEFNLAKSQAAALLATRMASSQTIANTYKLKQGVVWIVNNVKYIKPLNDGTSAQAPKLWVERSIALATRRTAQEFSGG